MLTQPKYLAYIAAIGSALLLGGAFGFQHIGGLAPCAMCLWQRWPHAIAITLGVIAYLARNHRQAYLATCALGAGAMIGNAGIALFHTGVERGWWQGPSACSGGAENISALPIDALLSVETTPAVVLCTDVAWSLAGLSMASWNGVFSLTLAAIWMAATRRA